MAITAIEFEKLNNRRFELIDKKNKNGLNFCEEKELKYLQGEILNRVKLIYPINSGPCDFKTRILDKLLSDNNLIQLEDGCYYYMTTGGAVSSSYLRSVADILDALDNLDRGV